MYLLLSELIKARKSRCEDFPSQNERKEKKQGRVEVGFCINSDVALRPSVFSCPFATYRTLLILVDPLLRFFTGEVEAST